tara:strand:- start:1232 stop:1549 length:318 start_codon:yes stop_codon:yes gene_type:complete
MQEQSPWLGLSQVKKQSLANLVLDDIGNEIFATLTCETETQEFVELLDQVILESEASVPRRLLSFLLGTSDLNEHLTILLSIVNEEADSSIDIDKEMNEYEGDTE